MNRMRDWPYDPMGVRAADLAAAAAGVRRFRTRRRAAAATVSVLAVAAAVSSRALLGVTTTSLVPTDYVPAPPAASPRAAVPSVVPPATGTGPDPVASGRPGPGGPVAADAPGEVEAAPAASAPARPPEGGGQPPSKPMRRSSVPTSGKACELVPNSNPQFCGTISLSRSSTRGDEVVFLGYRGCPRQPRVTPVVLEFPDDREIDFVLTDARRREVWRWSDGIAFSRRNHQVPVGPGECVRWDTEWRLGTRDGKPLPPGSYLFTAYGQDSGRLLSTMSLTLEVS